MIDERRPLPESIGGLVVTATRAYRRRFRLYFAVMAVGLVFEAVLAYLRPGDERYLYAGEIVVEALIAATVTIGVIADMRDGTPPSDGAILSRAIEKWGIVAAVTLLVDFIESALSIGSMGPVDPADYLFAALPLAVFWGSIGFATVIAAIDETTPPLLLSVSSIGRSVMLAFARQNFGRLIALALVAFLPSLVETVLADQLQWRKVPGWMFISQVPIDAIVAGPIQAAFTIFYLDFVRRSAAPRP